MKKHTSIIWLIIVLGLGAQGFGAGEPSYHYNIDLNHLEKDRYQVTLDCADFASDTLTFHFPWIIPGTYMEANYGKFIKNLKVWDQKGNPIKAERRGKNTYIIAPANEIKGISYWVGATWEGPTLRTIWPMAGTGIIPERVFVINAGGVFGYFQSHEKSGVQMQFEYPVSLYAMTVLGQDQRSEGHTEIVAHSYDELIDSPIMFAYPDTSSFKVHETEVLVGFAHETDKTRRALELSETLKPSMRAIDEYLDYLPAEKYAFLIYYTDAQALGSILDNPRFLIPKGLGYVLRHGIPLGGALEHNTSSFYYLPDPGGHYTEKVHETVEDIAIHEFLHILTPLNLHSQHIDDWDYNDPILSKHLWLYEGITEYMSKIIQVNGGLEDPKQFVQRTMASKIRSGERFPHEKMSFTEMSSNVLDKPYKRQYLQVYQRGAVLGMLLDIEIIRLTKGHKRLIDVMLDLSKKYGPSKPMDEEQIFDIFTAEVHPELRDFFTNYIEGRQALPYSEILGHVGVIYEHGTKVMLPRHPIDDNKVKGSGSILGNKRTIKKTGKKDYIGFEAGDTYTSSLYWNNYFDDFADPLPEGTLVHFPVERSGQEIMLADTVRLMEKDAVHQLRILRNMDDEQSLFFDIWMGFQPVR